MNTLTGSYPCPCDCHGPYLSLWVKRSEFNEISKPTLKLERAYAYDATNRKNNLKVEKRHIFFLLKFSRISVLKNFNWYKNPKSRCDDEAYPVLTPKPLAWYILMVEHATPI